MESLNERMSLRGLSFVVVYLKPSSECFDPEQTDYAYWFYMLG